MGSVAVVRQLSDEERERGVVIHDVGARCCIGKLFCKGVLRNVRWWGGGNKGAMMAAVVLSVTIVVYDKR